MDEPIVFIELRVEVSVTDFLANWEEIADKLKEYAALQRAELRLPAGVSVIRLN